MSSQPSTSTAKSDNDSVVTSKTTGKTQLLVGGAQGGSPVDPEADTFIDDGHHDTHVSDHESEEGNSYTSSAELHELDNIIGGGGGTRIIPNSNVHDHAPGSVDTILHQDYCEEVQKPMLPPVSEGLASIINTWARVAPKKEKIKEMFKQALLPENIPGLSPVCINDLVFRRLSADMRYNDLTWRGINTFFSRSIGPLVSVLDKLLKCQVAFGRAS